MAKRTQRLPQPAQHTAAPRPLRADARDNRERILAAALDVFVERGPSAPLDEVARRAGTGIATLYRRFPDRRTLMTAVVLDALHRNQVEAQRAAEDTPDAFDALTRYMHRALDIRIAAVIPALLAILPLDEPALARARRDGTNAVQKLVDAAHHSGTLDTDITSGDIGLLIVRLSRPLPGKFDHELNLQLSHRHLNLIINGLRTPTASVAQPVRHLAGPSLKLSDLAHIRTKP